MTPYSYRVWLDSLRALTGSPERAKEYRDLRFRFADEVGAVAARPLEGRPLGTVVYGVWLQGHADPVYVGQTSDASRRLYDLAIGESHHLANTYPPEIWDRLIVVDWRAVIDDAALDALESAVAVTLGTEVEVARTTISQAIEHLIQRRLRPAFNVRRKRRGLPLGRWEPVDFERSRSAAVRISHLVTGTTEVVLHRWDELSARAAAGEDAVFETT